MGVNNEGNECGDSLEGSGEGLVENGEEEEEDEEDTDSEEEDEDDPMAGLVTITIYYVSFSSNVL